MKHTPGPWSFDEYAKPGDLAENMYLTQDKPEGEPARRICLIAGHEWKLPPGARTREQCYYTAESIANARLIAAAPDLLTALRMFMAQYDGDGPERALRPEIIAARAAIAKATT
jgi:hypothetical protein